MLMIAPSTNAQPDRRAQAPAVGTLSFPVPSPERTERQLIAALQRGDDAAYDHLVRQYGGAMLAVARRLVRNEDDARDVVQDAFLQAFRSIGHFRAEARLSTWLHRIVVNAALMRLRAASRRPAVPVGDLLPSFDETGHHADLVRPLPLSVDEVLERAETRAQVRACVAELPEQYRAVIVLRDFEELCTGEVAQLLGISENAVKIRLHRARQALRTSLVKTLSMHGDRQSAERPRGPQSDYCAGVVR